MDNNQTGKTERRKEADYALTNMAAAMLFVLMTAAAAWLFMTIFSPKPYMPPVAAITDYSLDPMLASIRPDAVRKALSKIQALGSRALGDKGFYACENLLRDHFAGLGFDVYEQGISSVAARAELMEVLDASGKKTGIRIYPFEPNGCQPIATDDEGIRGTVLKVDDEMLKSRPSFEGCFALIDTSDAPPKDLLFNYIRYAQLGFEGLIITHPDGMRSIPWALLEGVQSATPLNYARIAAEPAILSYAGKEITLRIRSRFRSIPNKTLVAVMKAGETEAGEALVIPCTYGASGGFSGLAEGALGAVNLAVQMQLASGFNAYRKDIRRDVIFIALGNGAESADRLLSAVGGRGQAKAREKAMQEEQAANAGKIELVSICSELLANKGFLKDKAVTRDLMGGLTPKAADFLGEQLQYVLDSEVFRRSEVVLQAKIKFEKAGGRAESSEFDEYQKAKAYYEKSFSAAGFEIIRLIEEQSDYIADIGLTDKLGRRFEVLENYHKDKAAFLSSSLQINSVFAKYGKLVVFSPQLVPQERSKDGPESITFTMGTGRDHRSGGQPGYEALSTAIQSLKLTGSVKLRFSASRRHGELVGDLISKVPVESEIWSGAGFPAYSVVHDNRDYSSYHQAVGAPWMSNIDSMSGSLSVFGSAVLSVAFGNGSFPVIKFSPAGVRGYSGNVYVSNVGQSIIPNYPLEGAVVFDKPGIDGPGTKIMTDPYGRYERQYCIGSFPLKGTDYSPEAVGYDECGRINLIKDEGPSSQRFYLSMHLSVDSIKGDVNIVCFRAAPVTLLDMINPQSLNSYSGAKLIRKLGLSPFDNVHNIDGSVSAAEGILTTFIRPEEYFYVELTAGDADNELVQVTRAFMLGPDADRPANELSARPGSEIRGKGFLAADTPVIRSVASETAVSMLRVNEARLAVQNHFRMADERTREFQARARQKLDESEDPDFSQIESILKARDAVTYSTLNHPVLRRNIYEAVAGILWYLGLLVPFAFFFEKLAFGFSDVRKQLGAHVVIFLAAFTLLKILHPAFAMIRSSVMILLGFIIFLISSGILAMFSSRFKENLESIKQMRGQVTAAEVNKAGAIVTAFMLGLNNMHRRRVRTMLTCSTLVLITFVMICFTSIQNDIVDSSVSIGKAPYQGFLVKGENYRGASAAELFALKTKYGDRFKVVDRIITTGLVHWDTQRREYPDIKLLRNDGGTVRSAQALAALSLKPDEPLASHLVEDGMWFTENDVVPGNTNAMPVLISDSIASKLGLSAQTLKDGGADTVEINGITCRVRGVFSGNTLDSLLDLDGYNLMPFDIKALREINRAGDSIIADNEDPRISGNDTIIMPFTLQERIPNAQYRIMSVAVVLPDDTAPREAREVIKQFMEQSGRLTYFGLDGFSFLGQRARKSSFVGLVDMLIPLIIAAITVLNTIRGSVYERKEEIFVYNAVGIAPKHIFFMFFAEAFVYSVVGSVLGYILSQGTGRVLTAVNLTGGLNMTFTSLGTIYASLTIAASVFVSTWFPARTAMKIASPSDDLGWKVPEPDGDEIRFRLPFTFDWKDRIAVLAFFRRYFNDNGEGSSGLFFAGQPELGLADGTDPLNNDGYIPGISVTIWLKPFDLGVSQRLQISMPTDSETGEFVAEISLVRLSGTLENWNRLNRGFVGLVRTHFLHWRAVNADERNVMFVEARKELNIEG